MEGTCGNRCDLSYLYQVCMRVPQLWSNTKLDALLVNIIQHVV
jgi:hypothetical protein